MTRWKTPPPWALAVVAAMLVVIALSHTELPVSGLVGAVLAPAVATALAGLFPLGALGVCVVTALAMAWALGSSVPPWAVALGVALAVPSALAGRRMDRMAPALELFAIAVVVAVALGATSAWAVELLVLALAVVLPWGFGRVVRQQAELAAATAARVHLQERTRIAHDMHDTLGHELSLLALRAGALELTPDLDEEHRTAVADFRAGAAAATEALSDIVRVLRDGEPAPLHPVSDAIEDVVARAADAGLAVTLAWEGPRTLPPAVDRAAHRVVQEALTNAVKHAPGSAVHVRVTVEETVTVVAVTNEGGSGTGAGGGQGLVALRERVRLAGGRLDAGPGEHGFAVVATFPQGMVS